MKRRHFLQSGTMAGLAGLSLWSCGEDKLPPELSETWRTTLPSTLAGLPLEELLADMHHRLFDLYLPFWERDALDGEYGGIMTVLDDGGSVADETKHLIDQGRALWVYANLYTRFGQDPRHLEIAGGIRSFLVDHMRSPDGGWYGSVGRTGEVVDGVGDDVLPWLYVLEGLVAHYEATGDDDETTLIIEGLWEVLRVYDSLTYAGIEPGRAISAHVPREGLRCLDHSIMLVRVISQFIDLRQNSRIEAVLDDNVIAAMDSFYQPELDIMNAWLLHDFGRIPGYQDHMHNGRTAQATWMLMHEALRSRDLRLFTDAGELLHRLLELGWDYAFQGFGSGDLYLFDGPGRTRSQLYDLKTLSSHCDLLNGLLTSMEYTGEEWTVDWYNRVMSYTMTAFPTGDGIWRLAVDRYGEPAVPPGFHPLRRDVYHQPRYLMNAILILDSIIENEYTPTDFPR